MFAPIRPTPTNPIFSAIIGSGLLLIFCGTPRSLRRSDFGNPFSATLNELTEPGTLFSSGRKRVVGWRKTEAGTLVTCATPACANSENAVTAWPMWRTVWATRSEEHTSELQSQSNLVCRLLLEKKK